MNEAFRKLPLATIRLLFPERNLPLFSMFPQCGHDFIGSTPYRWHGLERGNTELAIWQYTISGEGALVYEDNHYQLLPGQAMLLPIPHNHCYYLPNHSDHWDIVYINLYGRDILRICRELVKKSGPVITQAPTSPSLQLAYDMINLAYRKKINSPFEASSYAYQFMMTLCNEFWPHQQHKSQPEFIKKVITYCINNISKPITVDDMAKRSGYSRYHFTRRFTESQGVSPAQFVRDLRLKHAVTLLQTEHLTIKEVAALCGFEDVSYFCKVFRKSLGHAPGQFKHSAQTK